MTKSDDNIHLHEYLMLLYDGGDTPCFNDSTYVLKRNRYVREKVSSVSSVLYACILTHELLLHRMVVAE
jgi:hypothetical protein